MVILVLILGIVFSVLSGAVGIWQRSNTKIDTFQNARAAFDIITRRLSQAKLNTYWDYYSTNSANTPNFISYRSAQTNTASTFIPNAIGRNSDLDFVCGQAAASGSSTESLIGSSLPPNYTAAATHAVFFAASTGLTATTAYQPMPQLLTACGFFVAFGSNLASHPAILSTTQTYRWRLLEVSSPTESLQIFNTSSGHGWFTAPIAAGQVRPLADNIIALVVWPRLAPLNNPTTSLLNDPLGTNVAPNYSYDSWTTHNWAGTPLVQPVQACQLPPTVQVTMVAMDEASAVRLQNSSTLQSTIATALSGLFLTTSPNANQAVLNYASDLATLEARLVANHITYRTFSTTVVLPESQWNAGS